MKIKLLLIGLIGMIFCSCSTVKHTAATADVSTKIVNFTVADIEINPIKVSKTYSWSFNPFVSQNIEIIKSNVTAEILDEAGADVIIEPQFIINKRGFLRGGSVTVIGFTGKYYNFHKMTESESSIIEKLGGACDKNSTCRKKRLLLF